MESGGVDRFPEALSERRGALIPGPLGEELEVTATQRARTANYKVAGSGGTNAGSLVMMT